MGRPKKIDVEAEEKQNAKEIKKENKEVLKAEKAIEKAERKADHPTVPPLTLADIKLTGEKLDPAATVQQKKLAELPPTQRYFEAPDGTLIIGEADKQQIWYRGMNNGKGGWINPRRA